MAQSQCQAQGLCSDPYKEPCLVAGKRRLTTTIAAPTRPARAEAAIEGQDDPEVVRRLRRASEALSAFAGRATRR
jgi:hypothetical protein